MSLNNMEINYNLIIKYLCQNTNSRSKPDDVFVTKKSIYNYANTFSEKFQCYLSDKFYRMGITVFDKSNNISFWSSLLTLVDKDFSISYNNESLIINNYKTELLDNFSIIKDKTYKIFSDKTLLRDKLNKEPDNELLEYIVNIINISFIIFDFKSNNIYTLYSGSMMNPYKSIFLFAKYDNYWEPIMIIKDKVNIQKSFNYNDNFIKKLLDSNDISYYDNQKEYKIMDLSEIITLEKNKLCKNKKDKDMPKEDDIFINDELNKYKLLNKTKLTKMKLEDIKKLMEELSLDIPNVKYTKAILIELILDKIKE